MARTHTHLLFWKVVLFSSVVTRSRSLMTGESLPRYIIFPNGDMRQRKLFWRVPVTVRVFCFLYGTFLISCT